MMRTFDWFMLAVVTACLIFLMFYYFQKSHDMCIRNPLVYGAKQLTKETGHQAQGYVWFQSMTYLPTKVYFNSTNSWVSNT